MNATVFEDVIADYLNTLESRFQLETPGDEGTLITPFERPDGDFIELELTSETGGNIDISDGGDTLNFLFASGLDVESRLVENTLSTIASSCGVRIEENEICLSVAKDQLGDGLHRLLNAIQTVNQLTAVLELHGN